MVKKKIEVVYVESGVPIPNPANYPLDYLEVGDSFTAPIDKRSSIASMATKKSQDTTKKFLIRKIDEDTIRVWRTE